MAGEDHVFTKLRQGPDGRDDPWLCVANPSSGGLRNCAFRERWENEIRRLGIDLVYTNAPGDARRIIAAAGPRQGIIVFGGDGSVFEIVNAMDLALQTLAVLPGGRGNAIARELGVPVMATALAAIGSGRTRQLDLMSCRIKGSNGNDRAFLAVNAIGAGYLPNIVTRSRKWPALGAHAYWVAALLGSPSRSMYQIRYGDAPVQDVPSTGIVVGNTRLIGNYRVFPRNDPGDGQLDIMELDFGLLRQKLYELALICGFDWLAPTEIRRCRGVSITLNPPAPLFVDGEVLDDIASVEITCLPDGLRCITGGAKSA
jgi:diacylglycerol kinase family enzyme